MHPPSSVLCQLRADKVCQWLIANLGDAQQARGLAHEHGIAKCRNQGSMRTLLFLCVTSLTV